MLSLRSIHHQQALNVQTLFKAEAVEDLSHILPKVYFHLQFPASP